MPTRVEILIMGFRRDAPEYKPESFTSWPTCCKASQHIHLVPLPESTAGTTCSVNEGPLLYYHRTAGMPRERKRVRLETTSWWGTKLDLTNDRKISNFLFYTFWLVTCNEDKLRCTNK